jgi:hypothetical protein
MTDQLENPPTVVSEGERVVAERMQSPEWEAINQWEKEAATLPQQLCPLTHIFTPGLYTRQIFMPKGTRLTSRIHLYEHPFFIMMGVVSVWDATTGWTLIRAPYMGITKPGTRRLLYMHEDTIWVTCHVTNETDPDKIVAQVTYDHMALGHMNSLTEEQMAAIRQNQKGQLP